METAHSAAARRVPTNEVFVVIYTFLLYGHIVHSCVFEINVLQTNVHQSRVRLNTCTALDSAIRNCWIPSNEITELKATALV